LDKRPENGLNWQDAIHPSVIDSRALVDTVLLIKPLYINHFSTTPLDILMHSMLGKKPDYRARFIEKPEFQASCHSL